MRHLYCDRDEDFISTMEKFIKTVVGNSYSLKLKQLLFRKKSIAQDGEGIEDREFFCSELIAKAFKETGLLNTEQSSCQFMPSTFSKEGMKNFKLEQGARFGEELMITFDEEDIKIKKAIFEKEEASKAAASK